MYNLDRKIEEVGIQNCFISETTIAELKFGVENSKTPDVMRPIIELFIFKFAIIPVFNALQIYANEKALLKRIGQIIDDFDILIGASAIANNMVMVTNNESHFDRLKKLRLKTGQMIGQ